MTVATGADLLLVGCGKMGGALLAGWLGAGTVARVRVVEPQAGLAAADDPRVIHHADAAAIPADAAPDVVLLAVKPQAMEAVLPAYRRFVRPETLFLSIAAGKTLAYFEQRLGTAAAIVRAMPNTPAAVGRGITVCCRNRAVTEAQAAAAGALLSAVGEVAWIDDEAQMDAVTALSGGGPAYVFLLIETLAKAGVAAGLPEDLAARLARATVTGSGELAHRATESPETLRQAVTSPGGTTLAALSVLMAPDGLQPLFDRALRAAAGRSRELAG